MVLCDRASPPSPARTLKPYIWRDFDTKPLKLRAMEAIPFHPLVYVAHTPIARGDHHAGCLLVQPPPMAYGRDALDSCGKLDEHVYRDD
jgi:hypothetical protein